MLPWIAVIGVAAAILAGGCASSRTTMEPLTTDDDRVSPSPGLQDASRSPSRVEILGSSVAGEPIELLLFGSGPETVLIVGGIHGDERNAAELAEALVAHLRSVDGRVPAGRTIAVLPRANPDGLARNTRVNANGVDLNRNFPALNWRRAPRGNRHGPQPASEPETRAIMAAVERLRPSVIVSIHAIHGGRECNNYDGPARAIAERMAELNGYPATASIGYPTPGSFGTWAGIDRGIPTITLELPRRATREEVWPQQKAALLSVVGLNDAEPALGL